VPENLPVAPATTAALPYLDSDRTDTIATDEISDALAELEEVAHREQVLLSSDALRTFLAHTADQAAEREARFKALLAVAKRYYPTEDGWLVVNLSRLSELLDEPREAKAPAEDQTASTGVGSLAEAIVLGNIGLAYDLIEQQPMVALATAAAELSTLARTKRGEAGADEPLSTLLRNEAANLAVEKVDAAIAALTSALDGTTDNEATAVQIAILRAINALHE
jgi:hypothetical protein